MKRSSRNTKKGSSKNKDVVKNRSPSKFGDRRMTREFARKSQGPSSPSSLRNTSARAKSRKRDKRKTNIQDDTFTTRNKKKSRNESSNKKEPVTNDSDGNDSGLNSSSDEDDDEEEFRVEADEELEDEETQQKMPSYDERRIVDSIPKSIQSLGFTRDTKPGDEEDERRLNMIRIYNSKQSFPHFEGTAQTLMKIIRKSIVRHVKFWYEGDKEFGSDEFPDFINTNFWGNVLFAQLAGTDYVKDGQKARTWITYKDDMKKEFSSHRSAITNKVKVAFENGEI